MKNLLIKFANNRTCQNTVLALYLIIIVIFGFMLFNTDIATYKFLILACWIIVGFVYSVVGAIRPRSGEVLSKNKLSHILFSSPSFVSEMIFVFIVLPYLFIFRSIENVYFWTISGIVWIVSSLFLSGLVGKYFEKKLTKD